MLMVTNLEVLNLLTGLKFNVQAEIGVFDRDRPKISNKSKTSATILDCNIDLTSDLGIFFQ